NRGREALRKRGCHARSDATESGASDGRARDARQGRHRKRHSKTTNEPKFSTAQDVAVKQVVGYTGEVVFLRTKPTSAPSRGPGGGEQWADRTRASRSRRRGLGRRRGRSRSR